MVIGTPNNIVTVESITVNNRLFSGGGVKKHDESTVFCLVIVSIVVVEDHVHVLSPVILFIAASQIACDVELNNSQLPSSV